MEWDGARYEGYGSKDFQPHWNVKWAVVFRCDLYFHWFFQIVCAQFHCSNQINRSTVIFFKRQLASDRLVVAVLEIVHLPLTLRTLHRMYGVRCIAIFVSTMLQFVCWTGQHRGDSYINETIARLFISFEHINSKAPLYKYSNTEFKKRRTFETNKSG